MEDLKVFIIAFNIGYAGRVVNGPGISLCNFIKILNKNKVSVSIATELNSKLSLGVESFSISNKKRCASKILESDVVHFWSGKRDSYFEILSFAKMNNKKIIIGPNVLDGVCANFTKHTISSFPDAEYITMSSFIKNKMEAITGKDFHIVPIGPNFEEWGESKKEDFILWKGNSKHEVKDVEFALNIKKCMPQYKFIFLGHPKPYDYYDHIDLAKKAALFIGTSKSETKCNALLEQWACGTPTITNPEMQVHGIHQETGIICSKNIDSYIKNIDFLMKNDKIRKRMGKCASEYVRFAYSEKNTIDCYLKAIK